MPRQSCARRAAATPGTPREPRDQTVRAAADPRLTSDSGSETIAGVLGGDRYVPDHDGRPRSSGLRSLRAPRLLVSSGELRSRRRVCGRSLRAARRGGRRVRPEGELGGPCAASTDCASRLCLTRVGSTPIEGYCTSACAADADCTGMQRCGTDRVCEPVPAGSRSAASDRGSTDLGPTWAALLLATLVASRIAKARTPGTSGELG